MKKSLLAVAVAAALPAAAFAQSNVTLYGTVDVGYGMKTWKDGVGATHSKTSGVQEGAGLPNKIGFMGTEDLGGGLKASFAWEQGFTPTRPEHTNMRAVSDGHLVSAANEATPGQSGYSATSLNRQTFVALSGGFGELRAGYARTLQYDVTTTGGYVLCSEGNTGCAIQVAGAGTGLTGTRGAGLRYTSPRIGGGLLVMLEYGAGNDLNEFVSVNAASVDLKNVRMGIGARYDAGPLSVAGAHTSHKQGAAVTAGAIAPATVTTKLNQLSAIYRLQAVQVAVNLIDGDNGAAGAANADLSGWQLSANVPMGAALSLRGGFGKQKMKTVAGVTTQNITSWQVGANYNLSKRTAAYVYHGNTEDKAVVAAGAPRDKTMTTVGLIHNF